LRNFPVAHCRTRTSLGLAECLLSGTHRSLRCSGSVSCERHFCRAPNGVCRSELANMQGVGAARRSRRVKHTATAKRALAVLSGEGRDGRVGPELAGKRKSRLGDCSVDAHLGERSKRGSRVIPGNPGAPVSNNNWRDPRQRRTFHPGVLFPLCCGGDHSSGSQPQKAAPDPKSCKALVVSGTLPSRTGHAV
jgi:hypothetical protein